MSTSLLLTVKKILQTRLAYCIVKTWGKQFLKKEHTDSIFSREEIRIRVCRKTPFPVILANAGICNILCFLDL